MVDGQLGDGLAGADRQVVDPHEAAAGLVQEGLPRQAEALREHVLGHDDAGVGQRDPDAAGRAGLHEGLGRDLRQLHARPHDPRAAQQPGVRAVADDAARVDAGQQRQGGDRSRSVKVRELGDVAVVECGGVQDRAAATAAEQLHGTRPEPGGELGERGSGAHLHQPDGDVVLAQGEVLVQRAARQRAAPGGGALRHHLLHPVEELAGRGSHVGAAQNPEAQSRRRSGDRERDIPPLLLVRRRRVALG